MFADRGECAHEGDSGARAPATGPIQMSGPRNSLMMWIGVWSGMTGVVIYNVAQPREMLPVNRLLLAIDTSLMIAWLLVFLLDEPSGPR